MDFEIHPIQVRKSDMVVVKKIILLILDNITVQANHKVKIKENVKKYQGFDLALAVKSEEFYKYPRQSRP